MHIDCDTCATRGPACADCVVSVLLGAPTSSSDFGPELDGAEQAALAVLAGSGLVPPLRLVPVAGPGPVNPSARESGEGRAAAG
jgi:hypothetical protein